MMDEAELRYIYKTKDRPFITWWSEAAGKVVKYHPKDEDDWVKKYKEQMKKYDDKVKEALK